MLKFVGGLAGNHIWPDDWVFLYGCSDTDQVISRQKLIVNIHTYCLLARLLLIVYSIVTKMDVLQT